MACMPWNLPVRRVLGDDGARQSDPPMIPSRDPETPTASPTSLRLAIRRAVFVAVPAAVVAMVFVMPIVGAGGARLVAYTLLGWFGTWFAFGVVRRPFPACRVVHAEGLWSLGIGLAVAELSRTVVFLEVTVGVTGPSALLIFVYEAPVALLGVTGVIAAVRGHRIRQRRGIQGFAAWAGRLCYLPLLVGGALGAAFLALLHEQMGPGASLPRYYLFGAVFVPWFAAPWIAMGAYRLRSAALVPGARGWAKWLCIAALAVAGPNLWGAMASLRSGQHLGMAMAGTGTALVAAAAIVGATLYQAWQQSLDEEAGSDGQDE